MTKIPIVSLFTGGGFLDMGFEEAGFEIVFSNENDKIFAELFKAGMNSWALSMGIDKKFEISSTESITSLSPSIIESIAFPDAKPELWGIIGGPPCQDFTLNGAMKGFDGDRGKMTMIFFNRIKQMQPPFFVMENVTGLLHKKDNRQRLDRIIEGYCKKDYYLDRFTLNAIDYGVPQNRERVFLIGLRKDNFNPPLKNNLLDELFDLAFVVPEPKYKNAIKEYSWPKSDQFGGIPIKPDKIPEELFVQSCLISEEDKKNQISNIFEYFSFKINSDKRLEVNEGSTSLHSFKRLHRYRYSPTACYGNNEVHLHPYENRRISVREALRIQGVPDSYALPPQVSKTKKFKMIGNGVPVPLANAVANTLRTFIEDNKIIK
jgi:DNA (cytosine-5)-methyltransferase 1